VKDTFGAIQEIYYLPKYGKHKEKMFVANRVFPFSNVGIFN
jgi:hypothetical protein